MNGWGTAAALAGCGICLSVAANSQGVHDGKLVTPSWRVPGNLMAVGCVVGAAAIARNAASTKEEAPARRVPSRKIVPHQVESRELEESFAPAILDVAPVRDYDAEESATQPVERIEKQSATDVPPPDLIQTTARYILDREGSGVLVSAVTDAGKTTLLLELNHEIKQQTNGAAQFWVVDDKGSFWAGLEELKDGFGRDRVLITESSDEIKRLRLVNQALDLISWFNSRRAERAQKRVEARGKDLNLPPLILIVDEWLSFIRFVDKRIPDRFDRLESDIADLAFKGREEGVHFILSGQDHTVKMTKIPTGARNNIGVISMAGAKEGKSPKCDAIESAVSDHWLVRAARDRNKLAAQLDEYKTKYKRFYYSSIGGHHMAKTPHLEKRTNTWSERSNVIPLRRQATTNTVIEVEDPWS